METTIIGLYRVLGFGGFRGLGLRVYCLRFRVSGLGFRV